MELLTTEASLKTSGGTPKGRNLAILKVLSFLFLIVAFDGIIGYSLRTYYFKQSSGVLSRTTYAISSVKTPGLILGSSRASHHFISDVLSDSLKMPFYNAGKDGQSIFYHYAVLKGVLKRYAPKIVVLDLLNDELDFKQESYDRLSELLPYYKTYADLAPIVKLRGPFEQYKLRSQIYPFNSLLLSIAIGNTSFNKKRFVEINGYLPLIGTYKNPITQEKKAQYEEIDSNKVNIYKAVINDCKAQQVKLIFTISPYLQNKKVTRSTILAKQIALANNVPFFDHSHDAVFVLKPRYFWDMVHLNSEGALIFTHQVITEIKNVPGKQVFNVNSKSPSKI
jgi:hypothetical protein